LFVLQTTFSDAQTNLIHLKEIRKGTSPIKNKIIESFANHLYLPPKALPSIITMVLGHPLRLGAGSNYRGVCVSPWFLHAPDVGCTHTEWEMGTLPAREQGGDHGNGAVKMGMGR